MKVHEDWRGVVIELDNDETSQLIKAMGGGGGAGKEVASFLTTLGIGVSTAGIVGAVIAAHIAWERVAIEHANKGNGVILTMPWVMPGVVIPHPRHEPVYDPAWATKKTGDPFISVGGDVITYDITTGSGLEGVDFRLVNACESGWDKAYVLRDGEGNRWWVKARGHESAQNGLWAGQCRNGQQLTFQKPSTLGIWINVLSIGDLAPLADAPWGPGTLVTFTWSLDD